MGEDSGGVYSKWFSRMMDIHETALKTAVDAIVEALAWPYRVYPPSLCRRLLAAAAALGMELGEEEIEAVLRGDPHAINIHILIPALHRLAEFSRSELRPKPIIFELADKIKGIKIEHVEAVGEE